MRISYNAYCGKQQACDLVGKGEIMASKNRRHPRLPKHKTRHDVLETYVNKRITVEGAVTRNGMAHEEGRDVPTLLLHDVRMTHPDNQKLSDHIWVKVPGCMSRPGRGDEIEFTAVVREYDKGYVGRDRTAAHDIGLFDVDDMRVVSSWDD